MMINELFGYQKNPEKNIFYSLKAAFKTSINTNAKVFLHKTRSHIKMKFNCLKDFFH